MGGDGFALAEYVTPRTGLSKTLPYGTMAKASTEFGSMLSDARKKAKNPGPEAYQQVLNKDFNHKAQGGTFSKLERGFGLNSAKVPAVGQYEITRQHVEPKVKGGMLPKKERDSAGVAKAKRENMAKQEPGKYDGNKLGPHMASPQFQTAVTESRLPKKPNQLGPGYYKVDHRHVEERVPSYGGSQEVGKTHIQMHIKGLDKLPGPGHHEIPDSKVHDRAGKRLHSARIVADRIITPRRPVAAA